MNFDDVINKKNVAHNLFNYIDDEDFEKELLDNSKSSLYEILFKSHPSEESKKIVLVLLTYIALKKYDGAFWPHVYETLSFLGYESKILENKIRDNLLSFYTTEYCLERRHSQIPVMNAIIPFKYAPDFFVFIDDIYTKNFDCDLTSENIEEELIDIFNAIKGKLNQDSDDFKCDYEKQNTKVYKLIRATKNIIITGVKLNELILFTKSFLNKIDAYYNGKEMPTNSYIDLSFEKWRDEHPVFEAKGKRKGKKFEKSKIPYFTMNNTTFDIHLHTPSKKFYGDYDENKFSVKIYSKDCLLKEDNGLKINYLIGGIEILSKEYPIEKPFSSIRCEILYDGVVVYNSNDSLNRKYMLFNEKGRELFNNKNYNDLVYFIYSKNCDEKLEYLKNKNNYKVAYSPCVEPNKEYVLDSVERINFSSIMKSAIVGNKNSDVCIIDGDTYMPIYNSIDEIILVSKSKENSIKIKINDKYVDEDKYFVIEQSNYCSYSINFEKVFNESKKYRVELIDIKKQLKLDFFEFFYDKEFKTNETIISNYDISFSYSGTFKLLGKKDKEVNEIELQLSSLNDKNYYFEIEKEKYKIYFYANVPYYNIDEGNKVGFDTPLNGEDIKLNSKLFFNLKNCDNVQIVSSSFNKPLNIKNLEGKYYVEIGELLNYSSIKKADIRFNCPNSTKIISVYLSAVYDAKNSYFKVDSQNNSVTFKTIVNGKNYDEDIYLTVESNKEVFYNGKIEDTLNWLSTIKIDNKIRKIDYSIYHYASKKEGFSWKKYMETIYSDSFKYYPLEGLMNKYLPITGVKLFNDSSIHLVRKTNLKLIKQLDKVSYLGYIFRSDGDNQIMLDQIGIVKVVLSQVYYSAKTDKYYCDASVWIYYDDLIDDVDYLQYDDQNWSIYEKTSSRLKYIETYKINLTMGEINYGKFKSSKKSKIY